MNRTYCRVFEVYKVINSFKLRVVTNIEVTKTIATFLIMWNIFYNDYSHYNYSI